MAKSNAVWGIDIGQTALKALRCRPHDKEPRRIVAEAFDYIEYPKILSQPEADRGELIADALSQFVSRNNVKGDRVAVSVPGQTGLARFIKLPPVESKKIPDIVKYEARQQIPFALEDVVWDYQQLAGGSEEDGYILETEVGLFAMKRDQVARSLEPLENAGIDVHFIQLAPLAIYNFVCFDRLPELDPKDYDPEDPPKSVVVISLGTDTTDLVITNGFRVWQRNIPIGGNHFTKALSKELKLTFSKAEHLKRHATEADDPKAVFQAMRPVFSDLLAEVQRSIGYFTSIDKKAKVGQIVALGNAMKLPGLQRYLSQNLDQEIQAIGQFNNMVSGSVTAGPQFKENILGFAVPYGLCVQGLGKSEIRTNLLPEEIVTRRLVKEKKPWAVAAAAALLVGTTVNYAAHYSQWDSANLDDGAFPRALQQAQQVSSESADLKSRQSEVHSKFDEIATIGKNLVSNVEGRLLWLEVMRAIDAALPKPEPRDETVQLTGKALEEDIKQREELHITKIDCQHYEDLSTWFTPLEGHYRADVTGSTASAADIEVNAPAAAAQPAAEGAAAEGAAAEAQGTANDEAADASPDADADQNGAAAADDATAVVPDAGFDGTGTTGDEATEDTGPTGAGWVIELQGYHYHNGLDMQDETAAFVRRTLIRNLREGSVELPDPETGVIREVKISELGISHPILVYDAKPTPIPYSLVDPAELMFGSGRDGNSRAGTGEEEENLEDQVINVIRYRFIVQFAWQPTPPSVREQNRLEQEELEQANAVEETF